MIRIRQTGLPAGLAILLVAFSLHAGAIEPSDLPPATDRTPVLTLEHGDETSELSLADVEELELYDSELEHFEGLAGVFTGVRLEEFLQAHGLDEVNRLRFIAADDYTIFLEPDEIAARGFLLVTRFDGEPLPRTALGPLMLVVPGEAEAVRRGEATPTDWIWALTEIRAR